MTVTRLWPTNCDAGSKTRPLPLTKKKARLLTMNSPDDATDGSREISFRDFQKLIRDMYYEKDVERGVEATFLWLMEEVGELATALREGTLEEQKGEFADVYAWLMTLANLAGVDMTEALNKYGSGCCGCKTVPCTCVGEKP